MNQYLKEDKGAIRRKYLGMRRAMDAMSWTRRSAAVRDVLLQQPFFHDCNTLLTYVAAKDNEVDTRGIIDLALSSGRRVLVPMTTAGKGIMQWGRIESRGELFATAFGLLEPKAKPVPPPRDALCLTPGIAFTRKGHRIGYGGGYYDRFLAAFQGTAVGLAFDMQIAPYLPVEAHDCMMNFLVTESGCYDCGLFP